MNTPEIVKPIDKFNAMRKALDERVPEFSSLIAPGSSLDPNRLKPLILAAFMDNLTLLNCTEPSVWNAVRKACVIGIEPHGPLGHAWIIPFRKRDKGTGRETLEAQLIVGYKGWLHLALRSGAIRSAAARVVYRQEVEKKLIEAQEQPVKLVHMYDFMMDRSTWTDADICASYFYAELSSGGKILTIVPRHELDRAASRSRSGWDNSAQFPTKWAGMARKHAVLVAFNRGEVPLDAPIREALENEMAIEPDQVIDAETVVAPPKVAPAPEILAPEAYNPAPRGPAEPVETKPPATQEPDYENLVTDIPF